MLCEAWGCSGVLPMYCEKIVGIFQAGLLENSKEENQDKYQQQEKLQAVQDRKYDAGGS